MDIMGYFFRILFIMFIIRSLIRISTRSRVSKESVNEEKVIRTKTQESFELGMKKAKESSVEMVRDEVCDKTVPLDKAYIVVREDKRHYFCSWECREKFINKDKNSEIE